MGKSAKLKVLVLLHQDLVPPDSIEKYSLAELEKVPWGAEFDVVDSLRDLGHEVQVLGVYDELSVIRKMVDEFQPDIAFNLLEEFDGVAMYDSNVVAYLELKGIPYTGCNSRGLLLAREKAVAKTILSYHRIPTPQFEVFRKGRRVRLTRKLEFPLFVKSTSEEASFGISQDSIVHNADQLQERVSFIHEKVGTHAIAETFIDGKELYVGLVGNRTTTVLPIWELKFLKAPDEHPKIATPRVKFDPKYRKRLGITTGAAEGLTDSQKADLRKVSKRIFRLLRLNGYARLDFRMRKSDGKFFLLEANPNPHIGVDEDFAQSAMAAGIEYEALLSKILSLGLKWDPQANN